MHDDESIFKFDPNDSGPATTSSIEPVDDRLPPETPRVAKEPPGKRRARAKSTKLSSDDVVDMLNAELDRVLIVREGGVAKKATALQVALLTLMRKAAEGDLPALRLLLAELKRLKLLKPAPQRQSGGNLVTPEPILTRAEFDFFFALTPDGRYWRQRPETNEHYMRRKRLAAQ